MQHLSGRNLPNITVTGASGFLGRALVQTLRAAGAPVLGVARSACPGVVDLQVENYAKTPEGGVLVHLAEQNNRGLANADVDHEASTTARFETLLAKGFDHVVYASSMAVYCPADRPLREDAAVCATDAYARAKLACEALALSVGGGVARLANLYGPDMARATVVRTLLEQIPGAGPVQVWDTTPVRDFIAVADAARAMAAMALGLHKGVFNIGTGIGVSVGELAATMLAIADQNNREVVSTNPANTPSTAILDIRKAAEYLNWIPAIDVRTGLASLLHHRHEPDE